MIAGCLLRGPSDSKSLMFGVRIKKGYEHQFRRKYGLPGRHARSRCGREHESGNFVRLPGNSFHSPRHRQAPNHRYCTRHGRQPVFPAPGLHALWAQALSPRSCGHVLEGSTVADQLITPFATAAKVWEGDTVGLRSVQNRIKSIFVSVTRLDTVGALASCQVVYCSA